MQERHTDRFQYFNEQAYTTEKHVIPFVSSTIPIDSDLTVLEIGCGEGGNLKPFLDLGCKVCGIDLSESKIDNAKVFFRQHEKLENLTLIARDIYDITASEDMRFDLIIMRDTLEHIPDQSRFLDFVKRFMHSESKLFLGFPPWRMPFGGHQQLCRNRYGSKIPYIHLLPRSLYKGLLKLMGESEIVIYELMEIVDTRINIQWFKRITNKQQYTIEKENFFLINPNYEIKFGMKPRTLPAVVNIPYLRDFLATTYYCVVSKGETPMK
jgi:SAM-dependent methyltransferase